MISSRAFYLDDGDGDGEGWWHDDDDTAGDDGGGPIGESGGGLDDDDDEFEAFGGVDARASTTAIAATIQPARSWRSCRGRTREPLADERSLLVDEGHETGRSSPSCEPPPRTRRGRGARQLRRRLVPRGRLFAIRVRGRVRPKVRG